MKRQEMSPAERVQHDIQQYIVRRARQTRIRAQELMEKAQEWEREVANDERLAGRARQW